ncbi:hypothetical protein DFR52_10332 [Hoeflea marina]|uniref:Uncharacterized protein n=1 Tax=Hoeflea marina TaxID=274592 RepID=A0A317PJ10_9HYPH|nr:hypothetical protein DFR52_10332 [Hoeflea marina]
MMVAMALQMTGSAMPQRIATRAGGRGGRETTSFVVASRLQPGSGGPEGPDVRHNPTESEGA